MQAGKALKLGNLGRNWGWGKGIPLILSKEPETEFTEVAGIFFTVFKRKGVEKGVEKG